MLLTRQRMQLAFIARAQQKVTRSKLERWLFLSAEEHGACQVAPFYDFVPAPLGPLSFTALFELAGLISAGLVTEVGTLLQRRATRRVEAALAPLPARALSVVDAVLEAHGVESEKTLLHGIHRRHPRFAAGPPSPPVGEHFLNAVYTCGYESLSVERFVDTLSRQGFERVIDVRHHAYSRKYGFTGGLLKSICSVVKLEYVHAPEVGLPGPLRKALNEGEPPEKIFTHYRNVLLPSQNAAQQRIAQWVMERPSVLMCFEADAQHCHRGILAPLISKLTGLPVVHLRLSNLNELFGPPHSTRWRASSALAR